MNIQVLLESTLVILPECILILAGTAHTRLRPGFEKKMGRESLFLLAVSGTVALVHP